MPAFLFPGGWSAVCRAAEGGGAAAAAADPAAAPDPAAAAAPGADPKPADPPAGGGDPAAPYRPEGLDGELVGTSDRDTIDRLSDALRAATAAGKPEDYVVASWDGAHKDVLESAFRADDPLYAAAREAAAKHGIPPAKFSGFLADTFGPAIASGLLPPPFNPAREIETWGKAIGVTDKTELSRALAERQAWAKGLGNQLGLSDAGRIELEVLTDTAAGLEVVDKLRTMLAGDGVKVSPETRPAGAGLSKTELATLDADPRIDPSSATYDPGLRRRYDEGYRRHYG